MLMSQIKTQNTVDEGKKVAPGRNFPPCGKTISVLSDKLAWQRFVEGLSDGGFSDDNADNGNILEFEGDGQRWMRGAFYKRKHLMVHLHL